MSVRFGEQISRIALTAGVIGVAVSLAACKTTSSNGGSKATAAAMLADNSLTTGSINTDVPAPLPRANEPLQTSALPTEELQPHPKYTVVPRNKPVKTASLGNAATASAVARRSGHTKLSLTYPEAGYTLAGEQSERLSKFVKEARAQNKKIKIIGVASAKRGKKHAEAREKARLEADKRAKATSMFLRVYGLKSEDMIFATVDERPSKKLDPRRVDLVLQ